MTIADLGILVRDDAARDKLRSQVGEIGLIMFVEFIFITGSNVQAFLCQDLVREQGSRIQ